MAHVWDGHRCTMGQAPVTAHHSKAAEYVQLPPARGYTLKSLGDSVLSRRAVTKFIQKKTPETGACLDWHLHLNAEIWQFWCLRHLLLWAEHNTGLRKG